MNQKKIAIFHTEFAYSGGAERLIFRQIDLLKKKGWDVTCFSAFIDEDECYPKVISNYPIKQILPEFINSFVPHDVMIALTTLLFPLFITHYSSFDLFLGENQASPWWAFAAARFWRKPFATYQNYPTTLVAPRKIDKGKRRNSFFINFLMEIFKKPIILFDRFVIKNADISFADGEYAKAVCEKAYKKEFINCPGGTDIGQFNKEIFSKRYSGELRFGNIKVTKPYILITNRHFPAKRIDYGIKLISKIKNQISNIRLIITGSETDHTVSLKALAKKLKVDNRVIFTDLVDEKDLERLYRNALIYIYTAPEEDYGLGILEAKACGVPSVVWDNAGPSYFVNNGINGYKIPSGDLKTFENNLKKLIDDKSLNFKISKAAYEDSKNYSWEKHGDILDTALSSILASKKDRVA